MLTVLVICLIPAFFSCLLASEIRVFYKKARAAYVTGGKSGLHR
jgi:hypothetical protein